MWKALQKWIHRSVCCSSKQRIFYRYFSYWQDGQSPEDQSWERWNNKMSKLNENIFLCAEDEYLFRLLCIFDRMEAKGGSYFSPFVEICWTDIFLHFSFPINVFDESTAFAFVSYACRFDIHFRLICLIAQIKFSNWITSYTTKLMENMSMKCQTTFNNYKIEHLARKLFGLNCWIDF